jgi:hypothetical protein
LLITPHISPLNARRKEDMSVEVACFDPESRNRAYLTLCGGIFGRNVIDLENSERRKGSVIVSYTHGL